MTHYTVTYSAYPSGNFTDTFLAEGDEDFQNVIDVACKNAKLLERERIIALLKADFNDEYGFVVDRIELLRNLIALIKGENE